MTWEVYKAMMNAVGWTHRCGLPEWEFVLADELCQYFGSVELIVLTDGFVREEVGRKLAKRMLRNVLYYPELEVTYD